MINFVFSAFDDDKKTKTSSVLMYNVAFLFKQHLTDKILFSINQQNMIIKNTLKINIFVSDLFFCV